MISSKTSAFSHSFGIYTCYPTRFCRWKLRKVTGTRLILQLAYPCQGDSLRIMYKSIGNRMIHNIIRHQIVIASCYYTYCDQCEDTGVLWEWQSIRSRSDNRRKYRDMAADEFTNCSWNESCYFFTPRVIRWNFIEANLPVSAGTQTRLSIFGLKYAQFPLMHRTDLVTGVVHGFLFNRSGSNWLNGYFNPCNVFPSRHFMSRRLRLPNRHTEIRCTKVSGPDHRWLNFRDRSGLF